MKNEKKESDSKKHEAAEKKVANSKMEMLEGKMHGKSRGSRSKNYKGRAC
jgi:hypothetical protein